MKIVLVAAAALGLTVSGAMACQFQKTVKADTMSVASLDGKLATGVDARTTASIARPADAVPAEGAAEE